MRFVPGGWVSGGAGLGAAVVLVLALAGCTGRPAPIVTELPSASPSTPASTTPAPSPSPSVTPLTDDEVLALLPDGAERTDLWGAMVTAQFFLEQYAPMFHSGDTRLWEALSADGCEYCADALENAERVRDEGWTARGGEIVVDQNSARAELRDEASAVYRVSAGTGKAVLIDASGNEQTSESAGAAVFTLVVARSGDLWRVSGVQVESQR